MTKEDFDQIVTRADLASSLEKFKTELLKSVARLLNTKEFYSPKEFSETTGMKYSTVIHYCNTGKLKARQDRPGGTWTIHVSELERYTDEAADNAR